MHYSLNFVNFHYFRYMNGEREFKAESEEIANLKNQLRYNIDAFNIIYNEENILLLQILRK